MTVETHTTFNECRESVERSIMAGAARPSEFDTEAITKAAFGFDTDAQRFECVVTVAEFWAIVESCAL